MEPIRITTPADLAAALPALLGYVPNDRLVTIAMGERRIIAAGAITLDVIDDPEHFAKMLNSIAVSAEPESFIGVLVTEGDDQWSPFSVMFRNAAADAGISVRDFLHAPRIAEGVEVYSAQTGEFTTMPDPATTPMATAAAVEHGQIIGLSRDELAAAHRPDARAATRRAQIDAVEHRTTADAARETIGAALAGHTDDDAVIRAAAAYRDVHARDIVSGLATGSHGDQFTDWAITVARQTGTADAYGVAAAAAYVTNRTVIAAILVEEAYRTGEVNRLARLIGEMNAAAMQPEKVCDTLRDGATDTATEYGISLPG